MFSVSFFCVVSGSSDMRACRADNEVVVVTTAKVYTDMEFSFFFENEGSNTLLYRILVL